MPAPPVLVGTTPDCVDPVAACALASALAKSVEVGLALDAAPVENEAPVDEDAAELPASDAGSRTCC
jgi:hypothetical protein